MTSTRITRHVNAPRAAAYRELLDPVAVANWMVPTGMTSHIHAFAARAGGMFRISLTYDFPTATGRTSTHTDTYYGRFEKLVMNEQVVETVEFEASDPAPMGEMTITVSLPDADGDNDILAVHDGHPRGLSAADNEAGWRSSCLRTAAPIVRWDSASSTRMPSRMPIWDGSARAGATSRSHSSKASPIRDEEAGYLTNRRSPVSAIRPRRVPHGMSRG